MRDVPPNMVDYEDARRHFKLDVPEYFNFAFDVVDQWANDHTKLALISVDPSGERAQKHTFWELKVLSNKFANLLRGLGVARGDRAFLMVPRIPQWYEAVLGMMKLGVVPMPATTLCTPHDIEYRINRAEASVAITDLENAPKIEEVVANCPSLQHIILVDGSKRGWVNVDEQLPDMSAHLPELEPTRSDAHLLIYFTSGTVGPPKMVLHTQASYAIAHIVTAKFWQDLKPSDLHWAISDTGWAKMAYGKLFGQWTQGATLLQHNAKGRFDAASTLKILERFGVTSFCAPPTAYRMMVLEDLKGFDLSNLRHCTGAGEPPQRRGDEGLGGRNGADHLRWLRADGDRAAGSQLPVYAREARFHGQTSPRFPRSHRRRRRQRAPARGGGSDRGRGQTPTARGNAEGVLERPRRDAGRLPRGLVLHRRQGIQRRGWLLLVRGSGRRRYHLGGDTASGPSRWRARC